MAVLTSFAKYLLVAVVSMSSAVIISLQNGEFRIFVDFGES